MEEDVARGITVLFVIVLCWMLNRSQVLAFHEDASEAPHVDGKVVVALTKNHFWRPVPARADVRAQAPRLILVRLLQGMILVLAIEVVCVASTAHRNGLQGKKKGAVAVFPKKWMIRKLQWHRPRLTEIADKWLTLQIYEYVLRFQISMQDIGRLQKVEAAKQVVREAQEVRLGKLAWLGLVLQGLQAHADPVVNDEQLVQVHGSRRAHADPRDDYVFDLDCE